MGRTYGDHIMGLRVTGRRGRRLGPLRSFGRAAFCVFFPIGLFWCVVSPERRSVQDVVLWTRVVYDWLPRPGDEGHEGTARTDEERRAADEVRERPTTERARMPGAWVAGRATRRGDASPDGPPTDSPCGTRPTGRLTPSRDGGGDPNRSRRRPRESCGCRSRPLPPASPHP